MKRFSHYFPKKRLPVITVALVAVVAIFAVFYSEHITQNSGHIANSNQTVSANIAVATTTTQKNLQKDSDHDGLPDWKEILLGTDPYNPDTDGDGTNDGAEVAANRDPLIPGPNDHIKNLNAKNSSSTLAQYENLTPSEKATRDFYSRYLQMHASGSVTPNSGTQLSNLYVSEALKGFDPNNLFKTYTPSDIIVTQDTSKAALHRYGNAMGQTYVTYPPISGNTTELDIFLQAENSGNKADFEKIKPYVERYKNLIAASLKVPVPKSAVTIQLEYLNALSALEVNATGMSNAYDEPLKSGVIFKTYVKEKEPSVVQAFQDITSFFSTNNITYTNDEPGKLFYDFTVKQ
jgi:hypothetical protein